MPFDHHLLNSSDCKLLGLPQVIHEGLLLFSVFYVTQSMGDQGR